MILEKIKNKLQEIDPYVFYGMADKEEMKSKPWNYTVFDRSTMRISSSKTGYTDVYSVHLIRENFIPEELPIAVIEKMEEIEGIKVASSDATYEYIEKPNTNKVVEICSIDFTKPKKKG